MYLSLPGGLQPVAASLQLLWPVGGASGLWEEPSSWLLMALYVNVCTLPACPSPAAM